MKHKRIHRVLSLILATAVVLSAVVSAADYSGARDAIQQGFASGIETIDLEEYGLLIDDLRDIFYGMLNDNQLPWYAESFSYTYNQDTKIIIRVTPTNLDEEKYDRQAYERQVSRILEEAVYPGMSQWQIALSVHDYFASHFRYDESCTYFKGYDLLMGGTAVCEGYARAYMDVLKRAGLEAIYATSEEMNHGWNLVKINGNWYHVDVTWDDPISDCYGKVRHAYFLIDDTTISDSEHEHYGWVTSQTAACDDMNSGVFWLETENQICYESASVSYIRKDESTEHWIYRRDEQTGELTELAYFDAGYIDVGYGSYHYQNYGLSLWNGRLYFSDMENVYSMNTDSSDKTVVYTYDAEANGKFIRGSFVDEGTIYITLSDHDSNYTQLETVVPGYVPHEHSYTEQRVNPTCTEDGYVDFVCSCGDSYCGETIPAAGHAYDNGIITIQPTATTSGVMTYTCLSCGESFTETIPALVSEGTATVTLPSVPNPPGRWDQAGKDSPAFPILPIIIGAAVLIFFRLLVVSSGKKKRSRKKVPTHDSDYFDPYG